MGKNNTRYIKWYGFCPVDKVLQEHEAEESPDGIYSPWSLRAC